MINFCVYTVQNIYISYLYCFCQYDIPLVQAANNDFVVTTFVYTSSKLRTEGIYTNFNLP